MICFIIYVLLIFKLHGHDEEKRDYHKTRMSSLSHSLKIGWARSLTGILIDLPFELITTHIQGQAYSKSTYTLIKEGYSKKGFSFFTAGSMPYFKKMGLRSFYTAPILSHMPPYYGTWLKKINPEPHPYIEKLLTGATWAVVQTVFETPFEQKRVHEVLDCSHSPGALNSWTALRRYYRGGLFSFYFAFLSWGCFLTTDQYLRTLAMSQHPEKTLTFFNQGLIGLILAGMNVGLTTPFLMVRTTTLKDPGYVRSYWSTVMEILNTQGVKGLYRGWPIRLMRSCILCTIDSAALNYYENQFTAIYSLSFTD